MIIKFLAGKQKRKILSNIDNILKNMLKICMKGGESMTPPTVSFDELLAAARQAALEGPKYKTSQRLQEMLGLRLGRDVISPATMQLIGVTSPHPGVLWEYCWGTFTAFRPGVVVFECSERVNLAFLLHRLPNGVIKFESIYQDQVFTGASLRSQDIEEAVLGCESIFEWHSGVGRGFEGGMISIEPDREKKMRRWFDTWLP